MRSVFLAPLRDAGLGAVSRTQLFDDGLVSYVLDTCLVPVYAIGFPGSIA